jgi:hypothetical protein
MLILCTSRSRSSNRCPTASPSQFSFGSANLNRHIMNTTTTPNSINSSETAKNAQVPHKTLESGRIDLSVFFKGACKLFTLNSLLSKHSAQFSVGAIEPWRCGFATKYSQIMSK